MSNYSEAIIPWIDEQNLIGSHPNPGIWSTGNAILETSIGIVYEILLSGRDADLELIRRLLSGISACEKPDGIFNKNPDRLDQITHDDLKAAAALQRLANVKFATNLVRYGNANGWVLSNIGKPYFDAMAKPWDIAYYDLAAGIKPAVYDHLAFCAIIALSAFSLLAGSRHPSDDRLMWLTLKSISGISSSIDMMGMFWSKIAARKYQTVGNLMSEYYGNPEHPFAIYGQSLLF